MPCQRVRVSWSNYTVDNSPICWKCSFLIFFPTFNYANLNIVKKDHVHQKLVKIEWPQITPLASDHPKRPHSYTLLGPFYIPKTWHSCPPYTLISSCIFKSRVEGSQKLTFLAPIRLMFSKGNGCNSVSHQPLDRFPPFLLHEWYLFTYMDSTKLKTIQFDGLVGQIWAAGCQRVACTPRLVMLSSPNLQFASSSSESRTIWCTVWSLQIGGPIPWEHLKNTLGPFWGGVVHLW